MYGQNETEFLGEVEIRKMTNLKTLKLIWVVSLALVNL